jgi:hypothetical protein
MAGGVLTPSDASRKLTKGVPRGGRAAVVTLVPRDAAGLTRVMRAEASACGLLAGRRGAGAWRMAGLTGRAACLSEVRASGTLVNFMVAGL